jgi:hypothetical protein
MRKDINNIEGDALTSQGATIFVRPFAWNMPRDAGSRDAFACKKININKASLESGFKVWALFLTLSHLLLQ